MKNLTMFLLIMLAVAATSFAQEFKVVTIVESIVPGGAGRSRIIESKAKIDVTDFTTERSQGTDSKQKDVDRSEAKVDSLAETKLLNFYSIAGINFQNIASNDALITSKINKLLKDGWKLTFVASGVESDGGRDDGQGIFITRLFFFK